MGLFDDLIQEKEKENKSEFECWVCECKEFEFVGNSIFISSSRLKQRVICKNCGKEHSIIYDNDLNIIDVYLED